MSIFQVLRHWQQIQRLVALSAGVWLTACGGAGGGGGPASSSDPPPAIVTREVPLALAPSNLMDTTTFSLLYGETALIFGQLAHDWVAAVAIGNRSTACEGGGSNVLQLTDRDGNGRPSTGDLITVTLVNCYLRTLDDPLDGSLSIELTTPANTDVLEAGTITLGSRLLLPGTPEIRFDGALRYEYRMTRLASSLRVMSGANPFAVVIGGGRREDITAIDVRKDIQRDKARTLNWLNLRVASDILGGSVQISTGKPFSSWLDTLPDEGQLTIAGAGAQAMTARVGGIGSALLELSLGSATANLTLRGLATGYLWWAAGITAPGPDKQGYETKDPAQQRFQVLALPTLALKQKANVFTWQLSKPAEATSVPLTAILQMNTTRDGSAPWAQTSVISDVVAEGALITVTPRETLQPGASYTLSNLFARPSVDSNSIYLDLVGFRVADNIRAEIFQAADGTLFGQSARVQIDGSKSTAVNAPVSTVVWRQVSGPALTLDGPQSLTPHASISASKTSSGVAVLELEVGNAQGDFDRRRISIPVINDRSPFFAMRYQTDGVGPPRWAADNVPGSYGYARYTADNGVNRNFIDVVVSTQEQGYFRLLITNPIPWRVGQTLVLGRSSGGITVATRSCNGNGSGVTGSMLIREFDVDSSGAFDRLGLDIAATCDDGTKIKVEVRVNSVLGVSF
jgi:hypothetical protein